MELHRRCSRSNIPALVMLLLQLSVLLSGAAAVAIDKSETQVDVKTLIDGPIIPDTIALKKFEWDGTITLTVCSDEELVTDYVQLNPPYQVNVIITDVGSGTEFNYPGSVVRDNKLCSEFVDDVAFKNDPFLIERIYDLAILDETVPETPTLKTGEATFVTTVTSSTYDTITCGTGDTPPVFYRVSGGGGATCFADEGFDSVDPTVCYTITDPSVDLCVNLGTDSEPHNVIVCDPDNTMASSISITVDDTFTSVSLAYDGAGSKGISFVSSAADEDTAAISEAIVTVGEVNTAYRGTELGSVPLTGLAPNLDAYTMCVVGVPDGKDVIPLGTVSIQDTNLNVYHASGLLEFGFGNLNPGYNDDSNPTTNKLVQYTATANDQETVKLDCSAVPHTDVCFGFLQLTGDDAKGNLKVEFRTDSGEINAITTPFEKV